MIFLIFKGKYRFSGYMTKIARSGIKSHVKKVIHVKFYHKASNGDSKALKLLLIVFTNFLAT